MKRWLLASAAVLALAAGAAYAATTSTTMAVKDGNGTAQTLRADQNGDGTIATHNVPEVGGAAVSASNPLPVLMQTDSTQGTAGTGMNPPSGGVGFLGYLSGIYSRLLGTLTVQDSAAETSLATIATNTGGVATASNQATGNSSLATIGTAAGTPADAAYAGSGSSSIIAAVKGVYSLLAGTLSQKPAATATVATTPVTVGTSSVSLASAGSMTRGWRIVNTTTSGGAYVDVCWGSNCTLGSGFTRIYAGANDDWKGIVPPAGTAMSAIASAAGQTVAITVSN